MARKVHDEQLAWLYEFVGVLKKQPTILNNPELDFFRDYLVRKLKAKVPPKETDNGTGIQNEDVDAEWSLPHPPRNPYEGEMEIEEGEVESDVEYDDVDTIIDDKDEAMPDFGDDGIEVTEDMRCQAARKKSEAITAASEGHYDKAIEILTEAVQLNPNFGELFEQRASMYLKIQKPRKAIHDCNRAIDLKADSAMGYKCRGQAQKLLGKWGKAFSDLSEAFKLDADEETEALLRLVTPNARKEIQHNKKHKSLILKRKKKVWWELLQMLFEFVASTSFKPSLLYNPELKFYKNWLERDLQAEIPEQTEFYDDEDNDDDDDDDDEDPEDGSPQTDAPSDSHLDSAEGSVEEGSVQSEEVDPEFQALVEHFVEQDFKRSDAEEAVKYSRKDKNKALIYLIEGVPLDLVLENLEVTDNEYPLVTQFLRGGASSSSGRPVASGASSSAALNASASAKGSSVASLKDTPSMKKLFKSIQGDPDKKNLMKLLAETGNENPEILEAIGNDPEQFLQLFGEDLKQQGDPWTPLDFNPAKVISEAESGDEDEGASARPTAWSRTTGPNKKSLTPKEQEDIEKLKELGFSEKEAIPIYFVCDKNVQLTAIILLSAQDSN